MAKTRPERMRLPLQEDLTDQHLAGIGLMIAQWAHVENLLAQGIVEMLRRPHGLEPKDDAYLLPFIGMTGRTLIGLFRSIFKARSHSAHEEIDKLLDRLDVFLDLRNAFAHSATKRVDGTNKIEFLEIKTMNKLKITRRRFTANVRAP